MKKKEPWSFFFCFGMNVQWAKNFPNSMIMISKSQGFISKIPKKRRILRILSAAKMMKIHAVMFPASKNKFIYKKFL